MVEIERRETYIRKGSVDRKRDRDTSTKKKRIEIKRRQREESEQCHFFCVTLPSSSQLRRGD